MIRREPLLEAPSVCRRMGDTRKEGIARFDKDASLYIRPMYWAERGGPWIQEPDPNRLAGAWVSSRPRCESRRGSQSRSLVSAPDLESMPVDAKAGCLYPNNARAIFEAAARGFDNAVMCDMLGNVAELCNFQHLFG